MGKSEERRPPESGREPGENTAVAGLIMGIAAVVFWFFGYCRGICCTGHPRLGMD